jgi:hypothetical protein
MYASSVNAGAGELIFTMYLTPCYEWLLIVRKLISCCRERISFSLKNSIFQTDFSEWTHLTLPANSEILAQRISNRCIMKTLSGRP